VVRLFGERMTPVASPAVAHGRSPLRSPADLTQHVLLHLDDPDGRTPWLDWRSWLASNGQPGLKAAGSLRFRIYDQVVQAAVGGQGVALGRLPMIAEHLRDGRLVAPFARKYDSARGYFAVAAPRVAERDDVVAFLQWLADEAALEASLADPLAEQRPPRTPRATTSARRRDARKR
jgi:DNA-binding transcriptional LysR family regulator